MIGQESLVRYVLSPEGEVLVDYGRKLPGRGAYTHADSRCLRAAVQGRQFERTFKGRTSRRPDPEALRESLVGQIRERILNLLGMARKSGQAVSGSSLVLAAMEGVQPPALVLLAEDISSAIGEKILGRGAKNGIPVFRMFEKDLLGQILGKGERSAVAVRNSPLAGAIGTELTRYGQIVERGQ